ncbi:MAG TPA: FAD-dependent monooxygenase [Frateuria sp.]|uniref:FAD-dependent oxidoreductase n=1 Tax=Frateuria sp. TaxID=2211372 RepID=UPI002D81089A|nr:FAD-dependent monooxygenase [Frateuria sp.]HET6806231.1 FAD-dependent monooxygenase [Frateuria sp.]
MPSNALPVMIAGAGPTGLAAALWLARRGVPVRVVDKATAPSSHSKALAVNPRTQDLLEDTGVTARMLAEGWTVRGLSLHRSGHDDVAVPLSPLLDSDRSLLSLPQSRTEALLADALRAQGVTVERGVKLDTLTQRDDSVAIQLVHADGAVESTHAPLLYGADGAHSTVRQALGLAFPGDELPEPWQLWDLHLTTPLDPDRVHLFLRPDGFLFALRVRDDLWRVMGNGTDPLAALPVGTVCGEVRWQSDFHIAHRVAERAGVGRVLLGGDAAHVHSPLGARGMNLGIEDAYVFADCAADALAGRPSRLASYARLRHPVHRQVVRRVGALTRLMHGRPPSLRELRDVLVPRLMRFGPARRQFLRVAGGLDHPVRTRG